MTAKRIPSRRNKVDDFRDELVEVESSNIKAIGYTSSKKILQIKFNNDKLYEYYNFEKEKYEEFLDDDSKGKFLHYYIKGKYEFRGLEDRKSKLKEGMRVFNEAYNTGTILNAVSNSAHLVTFDDYDTPIEILNKQLLPIRK